jgi:hypothetical protein
VLRFAKFNHIPIMFIVAALFIALQVGAISQQHLEEMA